MSTHEINHPTQLTYYVVYSTNFEEYNTGEVMTEQVMTTGLEFIFQTTSIEEFEQFLIDNNLNQ